jgi:hypothetical protein
LKISRCKNGDGVGIYIINEIEYKVRTDLNLTDESIIEFVFIEIATSIGKKMIIGVIYRPPNGNIDLFETKFNQLLSKIDK